MAAATRVLMNPFNGIESREHPVVFDVRYSKTSNPFNGIER
jgi:hypothetical protein